MTSPHPRSSSRAGARAGLTLLEITVAGVLLALLLYVVVGAASLAKSHFLAGELSHAIHAAVVVGARLEDDLRSAVRDPGAEAAVQISTTAGGRPAVSLYRWVLAGDGEPVIVPVRWTIEESAGPVDHLARVAWDPARGDFVRDSYSWASLPRTSSSTGGAGFVLIGDAGDTELSQVLLTVVARPHRLERTPGAALDRITLPLAACVPRLPEAAAVLFRPTKRLEEIP